MTFDGNLAEEDVIKELVKKAVEAYGHIDVLVNNAGVGYENIFKHLIRRKLIMFIK